MDPSSILDKLRGAEEERTGTDRTRNHDKSGKIMMCAIQLKTVSMSSLEDKIELMKWGIKM